MWNSEKFCQLSQFHQKNFRSKCSKWICDLLGKSDPAKDTERSHTEMTNFVAAKLILNRGLWTGKYKSLEMWPSHAKIGENKITFCISVLTKQEIPAQIYQQDSVQFRYYVFTEATKISDELILASNEMIRLLCVCWTHNNKSVALRRQKRNNRAAGPPWKIAHYLSKCEPKNKSIGNTV